MADLHDCWAVAGEVFEFLDMEESINRSLDSTNKTLSLLITKAKEFSLAIFSWIFDATVTLSSLPTCGPLKSAPGLIKFSSYNALRFFHGIGKPLLLLHSSETLDGADPDEIGVHSIGTVSITSLKRIYPRKLSFGLEKIADVVKSRCSPHSTFLCKLSMQTSVLFQSELMRPCWCRSKTGTAYSRWGRTYAR